MHTTASLAASDGNKKSSKRTFSVLLIAIALAGSLPQPAHSYYTGNYRNWLYSLPYLGFSLAGRGGPYSANPLYSATSFLRRGSYGSYSAPLSTSPYVVEKYSDDEPLSGPRERSRPKRLGQYGVDESVHASWKPDPNTNVPPTAPPITAGAPGATPNSPLLAASPQHPYSQFGAPPAVPQGTTSNLPGAPPMVHPSVTMGNQSQSPIAQSFIEHLNKKFDGNIDSALFDPETRSLAKALGVVDHDSIFSADFSDSRKQVIKQILKDDKLGAGEKLQTLKILLSDGANRAMH